MVNIKRVAIITGIVVLVLASIITIFTLYKKTKAQEEQIAILEQQINDMAIEDLVEVVTAKQPIKDGTRVDESMLMMKQWSRSQVSPNMITDMNQLKGKIWKIPVSAEGPITMDMVAEDNLGPTDRLQLAIVDAITPSLEVGDYVDLRMITPYGINYVVMPKKRITNIYDAGIEVVMSEAELMVYSGLLIDQYMNPGTMVYTSKYLEPTLQKSTYSMYVPPAEILEYMKVNANMIYPYLTSDNVQGLRSYIESTQPWNLYGPSTFQTATQGIINRQEKITRSNNTLTNTMKSARTEYIQKQAEMANKNGQPVPEQASGTQVQATENGGANANGQYVDSQGVTRDANGNPVLAPGDLISGGVEVETNGTPEAPITQDPVEDSSLNSVQGQITGE